MSFRILLFAFALGASCFFAAVLAVRSDFLSIGTGPPWIGAGLAIVVGLMVVAMFKFGQLRVVRPLRDLRQAIDRIGIGNPDLRLQGGEFVESRRLASSVTELVNRQQRHIAELELHEIRLRTILEGMNEGVIAVDPRQFIVFANRSAGRMLDFVPNRAVGRPLYELTRFPRIHQAVEKGLASGQPHREEMEWAAGPVKHLGVYVARLEREEASGAIIVLNDTTELRRLEQLRRDFVANVSHELKTPLAVIHACVESLLDGAVEEPEVRVPFLRQIAESGERLHALILDLISLARIESGKEVFDFMSISLRESARDCLERHRPRADIKNIELLGKDAACDDIMVWVDPEALEHILDNLIDNAVKYTGEGGRIAVQWNVRENMARLTIRDSGPGIPQSDLPRIFERFYRVDKARSRELGGTGLGLSIVKHLVNLMGGKVYAESEMGRGTTMIVLLPLAKTV